MDVERRTIQKEGGSGMFSVDLRTGSSVSGRLQAGQEKWHLVVTAFVHRFLLSPTLLPFSFISSFSSVFPLFLRSFPRLVPRPGQALRVPGG